MNRTDIRAAAQPVPLGHVWADADNPVIAIEPNRPQVQPGTDVSTLRCVDCDVEPVQRCDTTGRLLYAVAFHERSCERLAALYADPQTFLFDPQQPNPDTTTKEN